MSNMIAGGLAWLRAQRKAHMTRTVTYRRGVQSVQLAATRGRSQLTALDTEGVAMTIDVEEFIVDPFDLVLGIASTLPQPGDTIEDAGMTFSVLNEPGLDCYRYCDSERASIRIHTKRTA